MPMGTIYRCKKKRETKQKRLARKVNRLVSALEPHYHDQAGFQGRAGYDHVGHVLTNMAEGDTSGQRNGLRIFAKYIYLNVNMIWNATLNGTDESVRLLVVKDKLQNGAGPPALSDVIESTNLYSTLAMIKNTTKTMRWQVLFDRTYTNPNQDDTLTYTKTVRTRIKLNCPIWYVGSGATNADLGKNNCYLYLIGDQSVASTNSPLVSVVNRLTFIP